GRCELVPSITAGEQSNTQHSGAPRGEEVPHRIADHIAVANVDAELLLALQKQIGLRLGPKHIAPVHDHGLLWNAECDERAVDLRMTTGRRDAVRDLLLAQPAQELDRAWQGTALRQKLAKELAVARLDPLGIAIAEWSPDLARDGTGEEATAHPDPPVDLPSVDGQAGLGEGALPREDVRIDRVDERPVEIENERTHRLVGARLRLGSQLTTAKASRRLRYYIWSVHLTRGFWEVRP